MIAHLRGEFVEATETALIVDVHGVGYELFVSERALVNAPAVGSAIKLFTHQHVREDDHSLFGFYRREERDLFRLLIDVNGVGARTALSLLSILAPREFIVAVQESDVATISRAKGIGKKTAQRVVLELQNKLGALQPLVLGTAQHAGPSAEAVRALISLGATDLRAEQAVREAKRALGDEAPVEELVAAALRSING